MASFDEHILQAKNNLKFLEATNKSNPQFWDWQVTTTFYIAVHIINAHLAKTANLHYRTHEDVKNAINPTKPLALGRVTEEAYLCFVKLEGLSRRSRYLCHDTPQNHAIVGHLTHEVHLAKAIRKLDSFLNYFNTLYNLRLPRTKVKVPGLTTGENLNLFEI